MLLLRRIVFGWVVFLVSALAAAAESLRLRAITPTSADESFTLRGEVIHALRGGKAEPLPRSVQWRLDGDLAENAALIHLSPPFDLFREQRVAKRNEGRELRYEVTVSLDYSAGQHLPIWNDHVVGGGHR